MKILFVLFSTLLLLYAFGNAILFSSSFSDSVLTYLAEEFPEFENKEYKISKGEKLFIPLKSENNHCIYESSSDSIEIQSYNKNGCFVLCRGFFENAFLRTFYPMDTAICDQCSFLYKNTITEFRDVTLMNSSFSEQKIDKDTYGILSGSYYLSFTAKKEFPLLPYEKESLNILNKGLQLQFQNMFLNCVYQEKEYFLYYIKIQADQLFYDQLFYRIKLPVDQGVLELNLQKVSFSP